MSKRIIIEGMASTFDPDDGPREDIGHELADAIYIRNGGEFVSYVPTEADLTALRLQTRVVYRRFPELNPGERIHDREIRKRLRQIRDSGVEVPPYSRLNSDQAWDLLMQIRAEFAPEARLYCPDVLAGVNEQNQQQRRDAIDRLR